MPPLDLAPIRARAEASTRGPWNTYTTTLRDATGRMVVVAHGDALAEDGTLKIPTVAIVGYDTEQAAPDATFIAASRADIPALLDEVERLRERVATMEARLDDTCAIRLYDGSELAASDRAGGGWEIRVPVGGWHADVWPTLDAAWTALDAARKGGGE